MPALTKNRVSADIRGTPPPASYEYRYKCRNSKEEEMTATARTSTAANQQMWEYEQPLPHGIVVAVDDSPESVEAFKMASEVARIRGWRLHVVSAISPFPSRGLLPTLDEDKAAVDVMRLDIRNAAITDMIAEVGKGTDCTQEVVIGRPARSIASAAESRGADLIVTGRKLHNPMERLIGGETSLQVMRVTSIPVLAVPTWSNGLKSVVVATDFSESSVKAARVAAELMGGKGTIHLVYVDEPQDIIAGIPMRYEGRSPTDIVAWFRRTSALLTESCGLKVEPTVLTGKPAQAVLDFAERVGAGMIAAGSHGYSRIEKFLLGSVSTALVRHAACPVMVARAPD
ncbi:MAG TPA: universal stress protein [Gemmatimonadaceae bacterium]|nr:universal stress protein [Gemmatimonadaceae bacterium]